jgi:hypothetical protein
VSRAGGHVAARRSRARCTPFPPLIAIPDAAAAFGTAFVLGATGKGA